jgi:hypothetical protein
MKTAPEERFRVYVRRIMRFGEAVNSGLCSCFDRNGVQETV